MDAETHVALPRRQKAALKPFHDLRVHLNCGLDLDSLLRSLHNNGFAHAQSTLQDIITSSMQDAQYSRAASQALAVLLAFKSIEHLTVSEIQTLQRMIAMSAAQSSKPAAAAPEIH